MIDAQWHIHSTENDMVAAVSHDLVTRINDHLQQSDHVFMALPGGKSPIPIFEKLKNEQLPWERVTIIPTDERIVSSTDVLSNTALLQYHFSRIGAHITSLIDDETVTLPYKAIGNKADDIVRALPWPLQILWLGMGADGHTASIFPGPDFVDAINSRQHIVGVLPDPLPQEAPVPRVTLSKYSISSAQAIFITIRGETKRTVLERAFTEGRQSSFPIGAALANTASPIIVHWSP